MFSEYRARWTFATAATLTLLSTMTVLAGPRDSGGGDTVAAPNGTRSLLDLQEDDALQYFDYRIENYSKVISDVYKEEVLGCLANNPLTPCEDGGDDLYAMSTFQGVQSKTSAQFNALIAACGGSARARGTTGYFLANVPTLKWAFVHSPLEEINDEGFIRVTNPATKKQVAIQKNGLVIINRSEFNSMDSNGKAALKIHENVLCATMAINPELIEIKGTAPVRAYVRTLVNYGLSKDEAEGTPASAVYEAARVLFPTDIVQHDLGVSISSLAPGYSDVEQHCSFYVQSFRHFQPNVIASCISSIENKGRTFFYTTTAKIALEAQAPVLSMTGDSAGLYQEHVEFAQAYVRKNWRSLLPLWEKYAQSFKTQR